MIKKRDSDPLGNHLRKMSPCAPRSGQTCFAQQMLVTLTSAGKNHVAIGDSCSESRVAGTAGRSARAYAWAGSLLLEWRQAESGGNQGHWPGGNLPGGGRCHAPG